MSRLRYKMKLNLAEPTFTQTWPCRPVSPADELALGHLMLDAYRGTIDYSGETLEESIQEVQGMFAGKYGEFLASTSFLVEAEGQPVAACLISLWQEGPLVLELMAHPNHKGRGLGTFLLRRSIKALYEQGYQELYLFVTAGNEDAQHIYEKLGFVVVEQNRKSS